VTRDRSQEKHLPRKSRARETHPAFDFPAFAFPVPCDLPPALIELFIQIPLPRAPWMRADAAEFMVERVQVFA
jgi:hypothetical protein